MKPTAQNHDYTIFFSQTSYIQSMQEVRSGFGSPLYISYSRYISDIA